MNKPERVIKLTYRPQSPKRKANLTRIFKAQKGTITDPSLKPAVISRPDDSSVTFSVPFVLEQEKQGRTLRLRTREDDMIASVSSRKRTPTNRAIRMANAIVVEQLLTTGKFGSATAFAKEIGVSQPLITGLLKMLNEPPEVIEQILFETKEAAL